MDSIVGIRSVDKRGEWYTVRGVVGGRETSVDIPANQIEGKSRAEAFRLFQHGLRTVAEQGIYI
jgi:hypothetical protein